MGWRWQSGLDCADGHRAGCIQSGKTKFTIENATKTRVVLADTRIHILGSYQNIRIARWAPFLRPVMPQMSAASTIAILLTEDYSYAAVPCVMAPCCHLVS